MHVADIVNVQLEDNQRQGSTQWVYDQSQQATKTCTVPWRQ